MSSQIIFFGNSYPFSAHQADYFVFVGYKQVGYLFVHSELNALCSLSIFLFFPSDMVKYGTTNQSSTAGYNYKHNTGYY